MADSEKLFLFFRSLQKNVIENELSSLGEAGAKKLLLAFAEDMLGVGRGSLDFDQTTVVFPGEWHTQEETLRRDDERFYEDAKWYLHLKYHGTTPRPYKTEHIVFRNTEAALLMVPVFVLPAQEELSLPVNDGADPKEPCGSKDSVKKPPRRTLKSTLPWENVYIFISSTFNDMHAERDYLVKKVFPELSAWCEERRLRLVDIDLRWGITEADSDKNKRTVEVCLKNIDKCRPFFLCFLGQRRGWVPARSDISETTLEEFPKLKDKLGHSVTELEIMHALIDPLRSRRFEDVSAAEHTFFYLRSPEYLESIKSPALRAVYTNEGTADRDAEDAELLRFREELIPGTGRPCYEYSASWDDNAETPELSFSLESEPDITRGRLGSFICEDRTLSERILEDLKRAITLRFGERTQAADTPLQKELEDQACFLREASESFVERENAFNELYKYIEGDNERPLILAAGAGMGKTSFLASFIVACGYRVFYRFVGKSDGANTPEKLAQSLLWELASENLIKSSLPKEPDELVRSFSALLEEASQNEGIIIIIDALDQLVGGAIGAEVLLRDLPSGVRLIASVKTEGSELFLSRAANYAAITSVRPFDSAEDRRRLVNTFLGSYLKQLDDDKMEALISAEGAENPLFLKVVLRELRVFGSHVNLQKVIEQSFGKTPETAFGAVLARLESDPRYCGIAMSVLTEKVFGWLSHSRSGLTVSELAELLVGFGIEADLNVALDAVSVLLRQMRPYLAVRDGKTDFFFDSFKKACLSRYEKNRSPEDWHRDLAEYFAGRPVDDSHRLSEQAFQYARAGLTESYLDYVFNFGYVENRLECSGTAGLIEDLSYFNCGSTRILTDFYRLCSNILRAHPNQLINRLFGHLSGTKDENCQKLLESAEKSRAEAGKAWLRPKNTCFERPGSGSVRDYRSDFELGSRAIPIADDKQMLVRVRSQRLAVWDIERDEIIKNIGTDAYLIRSYEVSPDGRSFAALLEKGEENLLRVWDALSFAVRCDVKIERYYLSTKRFSLWYASVNPFAFTDDSRAIILKDCFGEIKIFDAETGLLLSSADYRGEINAYGIGGSGLVVVGNMHPQRNDDKWYNPWFKRDSNPLGFFDYDAKTHTLKQRQVFPEGHKDTVVCTAASPDGKLAASADTSGCVRLWDALSGALLAEFLGNNKETEYLRFIKGGAELLSIGCGGTLSVYSTVDYSVKAEIFGLGSVMGADLFKDETHCVLRTSGGTIRLVSLNGNDVPRDTAGEALRGIGQNLEKGLICASSYKNFIAPHYTPTAIFTVDGSLHFFNSDTGGYAGKTLLHGCDNFDFVFTDPQGRFVVSKAGLGLTSPKAKYWSLDGAPFKSGAVPSPSIFSMPGVRLGTLGIDPNRFRFTDGLRYLCAGDAEGGAVSVFRSSSGRFMGKITLVSAGKLTKNSHYAREYEVTPNGEVLYVFYPQDGWLEAYNIAKGRRLFEKELKGFVPSGYSSDLNYNNDSLELSGDGKKLLYLNEDIAALMDITSGMVEFQLDRRKYKPGKGWSDSDTFAAMSRDARFLGLSRALFGESTETQGLNADALGDLSRTDRFEVWDMKMNVKVAEFYTGGAVSNILAGSSDKNFTFGLSNGRICTLELIGYEYSEEKSNLEGGKNDGPFWKKGKKHHAHA